MNKTFYANQGRKSAWKRQKASEERYYKPAAGAKRHEAKEEYFLVDGYNIIYAWPELKKLADENLDGARMKLLDMLSNYQWIRRMSCHCRI